MLYVKEIIRPIYGLKDNTQLPPRGQKGVEIASMPLMPVDKWYRRYESARRDTASEV